MSSPASQQPRPRPAPRQWLLAASMLAAIAIVTGLAWMDENREDAAALRDLEAEQSVVAASLAGALRSHLPLPEHGGRSAEVGVSPIELLDRLQDIERAGDLKVLVGAPGQEGLLGLNGRLVRSPALRDAVDRGMSTLRLSRSEATEVGLTARTAVAGIAHVDVSSGHWAVLAVASAARERDREKRAQGRLVLGVVLASGLVLSFGGLALRKQRRELDLSRELAVAEAQRDREQELARVARIATMGTFAMGIVHEVATPLGVILGRAEQILTRPGTDERVTRNATLIMEQADHIQQVARRFLDMARGGQPTLDRVDPAELARVVATSVEHRFVKANVSLTTDTPAWMPAVRCDRALLEHAIVNIVLNACEACPPGGHVELAARADAESVAFVVTDDGAGIDAEHAARVTEPFFTTRPAGTGTGLGLAIATEIAKSHRGELTIAPNGQRGTRVCIAIPIVPEGEANHALY